MRRKTVFLTGASGNMGREGLRFLLERGDVDVVALVLPTDADRRVMQAFDHPRLKIVWGDLTNYDDVLECVTGADYVLHVAAVVSPFADAFPALATRVNIGSIQNIVRAIRAQPDPDAVRLVYIGTVAQTGSRMPPGHWGRTGDPIQISVYDNYALTKTIAEREVIESGLRYWVSLRQTGIAHLGLLDIQDPIMFHTPLNGVLEWVTARDSGRLLANVCEALPDSFWRRVYNVGGGASCRVTNFEFLSRMFGAIGIDDLRRVVEPNWYATRNFHGQWYEDSDRLDDILHFRRETLDDFIAEVRRDAPWHLKLGGWVSAVVKWRLRSIARGVGGTLRWVEGEQDKIIAYFGSRERWAQIPGWDRFPLDRPSTTPVRLDHGYDETKPEADLDLVDMRAAADFRGGRCLSDGMTRGDLATPLRWRCAFDHDFEASPTLVLLGGHWCERCLPTPWRDDEIARRNPFLAQVWRVDHEPDEDHVFSLPQG